ncbi:MAG: right-handed parallel beta-helix repeat-containing protein [Luteitalea sp.]|nr:right-handed parallel beta-helix repeat-containing protein [Luteitalea sp.]
MTKRVHWPRVLLPASALALAIAAPSSVFAQAPAPPGSLRIIASPDPQEPVVVIWSDEASLQPGSTRRFTAVVTGTSEQEVTWTATGGNIASDGTYTAGETQGSYRVTATTSEGSISASAPVTIGVGSAVEISPGHDIQAIVADNPSGATFLLNAGVHRLQAVIPKDRQTFIGEPGTILSGAQVLTGWVRSGSTWYVIGQTQQGSQRGECLPEHPRCAYPEDLFVDNEALVHTDSLSNGGPGKWFFDYAAERIYVWDDPTGHVVETSVTPYAFDGAASGVTITNLVVEKYANRAEDGAIQAWDAPGWTILDNEVRWNHGIGIHMADDRRVLNNHVHHNGQMGIGGKGDNSYVVGNEIAYNNAVGFDPYWSAGGTKFTFSDGLTISGNFSHHNGGPGLWTDTDNINVVFEYNRCEDNTHSGISHEIGYKAIIRHNTLRRNGTKHPYPYWVDGGGIVVSTSSDVEVYGNTLEENWQGITGLDEDRGKGRHGVYTLTNFHAYDNVVKSVRPLGEGSGRTGITGETEATFTRKGNLFTNNTYELGPYRAYFFWLAGEHGEAAWKGFGQDVSGRFTRTVARLGTRGDASVASAR